jgi:hypothetical protein
MRTITKDAEDLLNRQNDAIKRAIDAAARPDTLGKPPEQLTPEQRADLANLGERQNELGRNVEDLRAKMDQMARRMEIEDPLAAAALKEAADRLRDQNTAARMAEAAEQLRRNQMGAARQGQDQAKADLENLVDQLKNRRERELSRLVKELKNAEAELDRLRQRQGENLRRTQEAANLADPEKRAQELQRLSKEQQRIQEDLKKQLQKLSKLRAENAARSGARASQNMDQARQDFDQGDAEAAQQNQEDALNNLEQAREEVEQARREAEEQLAAEQLGRIGDQLRALIERQEKMIAETLDYDRLKTEKEGKLTRGQTIEIRNLGNIQDGIQADTLDLAERLDGAPVVALVLRRAGENMSEAAQRLKSTDVGAETQDLERQALKRFEQLRDAIRNDQANNGQQQGGGEGGGGGGGGGGGEGLPSIAQLKLLKLLQEDLNRRTELLDELQRRRIPLTPDQEREASRLVEEQKTIADLARDLTKPIRDDGEQ